MSPLILTRPVERSDYDAWRALWDGYNAFYGRVDETALPEEVTSATWERFFTAAEPVRALVAEYQGRVVGLAHYIFHRSTTRLHDVCYVQDLFTAELLRGKGVGRQLLLAVYDAARREGCSRVGTGKLRHQMPKVEPCTTRLLSTKGSSSTRMSCNAFPLHGPCLNQAVQGD